MSKIPDRPFTTEDFSPKGGGIDFLGLRWVGLRIVGRDLIPQLNNVTTDMGTFFLGAWIPWKFRSLTNEKSCTEKNYRLFREKVEVALSLSYRGEAAHDQPFGSARNKIGVAQVISLPSELSFKTANRRNQNSLYAAAIYGPALQALGLIKSYRVQAKDGTSLGIALAGDSPDVGAIIKAVDESLQKSDAYAMLASLDSPVFDWGNVASLAAAGLNPAQFRGPDFSKPKKNFLNLLLPTDSESPGYARTETTRLLLHTLSRHPGLHAEEIRNLWYTGLDSAGGSFVIHDQPLEDQRMSWSFFMARQYQRWAIELFLWCFEMSLSRGARSIDDAVDDWMEKSGRPGGAFRDHLVAQAGKLWTGDVAGTSARWNESVKAGDDRFECVDDPLGDHAAVHGLDMLSGWYLRMLSRPNEGKAGHFLRLGEADRLGMGWFLDWLTARMDRSVKDILYDIFTDLVFSQHLRVALSRFDGGGTQRLRFMLGDRGIEPTTSARNDLGKRALAWMPDRLDMLVDLLADCDVVTLDNGKLFPGPKASDVLS